MEQKDIDDLTLRFEQFFEKHERYPTSADCDTCPYLPSSRYMQRHFGGIVAVREELGLQITDYTKGAIKREVSLKIGKRSLLNEKEVLGLLVDMFGRVNVHREYLLTDDSRCRIDFHVFAPKGRFSVEVFFPKNRCTLSGCLNAKLRKYSYYVMMQYPVAFLQMNKELDHILDDVVKHKKNKMAKNQYLIGLRDLDSWGRGWL